jgi:hypothetical protein
MEVPKVKTTPGLINPLKPSGNYMYYVLYQ